MADTIPERRDTTGEQPTICVKTNNGPSWKWIVGVLIGMIAAGGGAVVKIHVDIARVEERIISLQREVTNNQNLQIGLNSRFDRELREARESVIELKARTQRRHK